MHPCPSCWTLHRGAHNRCAQCYSPVEGARRQAKAERYDAAHVALRAKYALLLSVTELPCARCGAPIEKCGKFHLDHLPSGESKPSHPLCNTKARHTDKGNQ